MSLCVLPDRWMGFSRPRWILRPAGGLGWFLLLLLFHCDFGGYTPPTLPGPSIRSFAAAKTPITRGTSTTLTAVFANGLGRVDQGVGLVASTVAQTVTPAATTTYTLTVTASPGAFVKQAQTVVVVDPPVLPVIVAPDPSAVGPKQANLQAALKDPVATLTYTWTLTQGTITAGQGTPAITFSTASHGLCTLSCTATNAAGTSVTTDPNDIQYRLGGATILAFTAQPLTVVAGTPSTLSFSFLNGVTATITPPGASVISPGTLLVTPTGPATVYTLTVTDQDGLQDTRSVTVNVESAPSLTAAAPIVGLGTAGSLVAVFDDSHGETATVDHGVGAVDSGTPVPTPALGASTTFTLTVSRDGLPFATATARVRVARMAVLAGIPSGQGSLDGSLAQARYLQPEGMAVDGDGNLLLADPGSHTIRKITPAGLVSTLAGAEGLPGSADGQGAAARFNQPMAVAVGPVPGSNLFVADAGNNTIRMITPDGEVTTVAGAPPPALPGDDDDPSGTGGATFNFPTGIAVAAGSGPTLVYVADAGNRSIRLFNPSVGPVGSVTTFSTGPAIPSARFAGPGALAWDPDRGQLLVADTGGNAIYSVTAKGAVLRAGGAAGSLDGSPGTLAQFRQPAALAVGKSGTPSAGLLVVGDTGNSTLRTVSLVDGNASVQLLAGAAQVPGAADGAALSAARFRNPQGLAVDALGNLFVADTGNATLRQLAAGPPFAGVAAPYSGLAGGKGGSDSSGAGPAGALFHHPARMAFDPKGNLIVADAGNNTLRQVAPDGTVTTLPGLAGAGFNAPSGLAIDPSGIIYLADTGNHVIRKIVPATATSAAVVSTLAGTIGVPGSDDDPGSPAGSFRFPVALALDGAGFLIVADQGNHTLRRLAPDGSSLATLAGDKNVAGATDGPIGPGVASPVTFDAPAGLAVWKGNTIYVADAGSNLVRQIVLEPDFATGLVTPLAGTAHQAEIPGTPGVYDGVGKEARLNLPEDIALDGSGNLLVANRGSSTVCLITAPQGAVTTFLGDHAHSGTAIGTLPSTLSPPTGVAVDPSTGNLFVSLDDAILELAFQ